MTTITSASAAAARAASAKQSPPDGQRLAPGHSRADTLTAAHADGDGSTGQLGTVAGGAVLGPRRELGELGGAGPLGQAVERELLVAPLAISRSRCRHT